MRLMLKTAGEIGVKSPRTRRRFLRILRENVHAALARAGVRGDLDAGWGRMHMETPDPTRARAALAPVFGLHSISEVEVVPATSLDELVKASADVFRDRVAGRTFAVRARRVGEHPFRSRDVNRELGTALLDVSAGVNLGAPEVQVAIEIVHERGFAIVEAI